MVSGNMKAAVIEEVGRPLVIRNDVPIPKPGPGEVLVKIKASGVCYTDLEIIKGYLNKSPEVKIPGHEGIGVVVETGPGVWRLKEGDRVGVPYLNYWCGSCEYCLKGDIWWCPNIKGTAFSRDGTFAQYAVIDQRAALMVPKEISDIEAAPLTDAGLTSYGAIKKLVTHFHIPAGKTIAIVGAAGGLGHYAVQIAKSFGYKVVGIDVGEERIKFVEKIGADWAVEVKDAVKFVQEKLNGVYASVVTANKLAAYELALKIIKPRGALVIVGIPPSIEGNLPITPANILFSGVEIVPSITGNVVDMDELFSLVLEGKVKGHISRISSLDEINNILKDLEEGKYWGRAVVTVD